MARPKRTRSKSSFSRDGRKLRSRRFDLVQEVHQPLIDVLRALLLDPMAGAGDQHLLPKARYVGFQGGQFVAEEVQHGILLARQEQGGLRRAGAGGRRAAAGEKSAAAAPPPRAPAARPPPPPPGAPPRPPPLLFFPPPHP